MRTRSKFNVSKDKSKRTFDGIVFDSIVEMKFYKEYVLPKHENGEILEYEMQKQYELQPKFSYMGKSVRAINYVADYVITYADGHTEVIDIKGQETSDFKIKKKLFEYKYPDTIFKCISWSPIDGGWIETDDLKKARRERKKKKEAINKQ